MAVFYLLVLNNYTRKIDVVKDSEVKNFNSSWLTNRTFRDFKKNVGVIKYIFGKKLHDGFVISIKGKCLKI